MSLRLVRAVLPGLAIALVPLTESIAHEIVGNRFFPATLGTDDPGVNDELALPTVSTFKTSADPSIKQHPASAQSGTGTSDMRKMAPMSDTKTATASGTVTALNAAAHKIPLDYGPIPAINWPAMKMEFAVAPSVDLSQVKTGDKVDFTLSGSGHTYTVQSIIPIP